MSTITYDVFTKANLPINNAEYISHILSQDNIPVPKGVYARLLGMFEDSSSRDIVKVIQTNPILTSKILGAANSVAFSPNGKVSSLPDAVLKLGLSRIRQIVLSMSIIEASLASNTDDELFDFTAYSSYSLAVAVVSEMLASESHIKFMAGDFFTVGLLSQICWPIMASANPEKVSQFNTKLSIGATHEDSSDTVFNEFPSYISSAIAEHVGLPIWVVNTIGLFEYDFESKMSDRLKEAVLILKSASAYAQDMQPFKYAAHSTCTKHATDDMIVAWGEWRRLIKQ